MQFLLASLAAAQASSWYDNGWIIGIATGLASGALLALITPLFLRKRKARDLAVRRERAADDVLSALRPSVASGYLPSASVVDAIARASAYERRLDPKLAVSTLTLLDVLVNEIMVSAFLDPEARLSKAKQLLELRTEVDNQLVSEKPTVIRGRYTTETAIVSLIGAITSGAAAAVSTIIGSWVPVVVVLSIGVFAILITLVISRLTYIKMEPIKFTFTDTPTFYPAETNGKDAITSDRQQVADGEQPRGSS